MFNVLTAISLGEAGVTGLLGYAVVFLGLFLLMVVVIAMGKIMAGKMAEKAEKTEKPAAPAPVAAPAAPVAAAPAAPASGEAPGSAGQLKLYDTPDRDAALIMAIVADQMGKPLNELRFKSIKEVK